MKATAATLKVYLSRALFAAILIVPVVVTKISPAAFSKQDTRTHVEIDGVNYGVFDKVDGLVPAAQGADGATFHRVTFKRDFVTDPSLYLWAKNVTHGRSDLKDVQVVVENHAGEEVSRYVLKMCQPLSWTVEAANPAQGGFHENIDMAVQEIAVY